MAPLMSIGSLIDDAWEHYRKHFATLTKVNAWVLVVVALNIIALFFYPLNADQLERALTGMEIFGIFLFLFANLVVAVVVNIWIFNALINAIDAQIAGKRVNMAQLTTRSWKQFPQMLVLIIELMVLYGISFVLPIIVYWLVTVPGAAILPVGVMIALAFLAILLFIPPFILMVYLSFARFALISDGMKGIAAIKESARLVKGRFWPVLWRLAIPKILYFILLALGQFLLMTIFSVLTLGSGQEQTGIGLIAAPTSYYILLIFINPLLILTDQLIYRRLKQ